MESPEILLQRVLCCSSWKTMAGSNRATVTESEPSTGEIVASFPHNSQPGSNSLREEDIPGASLNDRKPSDLHVVESSVG